MRETPCLKGKGEKTQCLNAFCSKYSFFLGSKVSDCNDEKATELIMSHHRCGGDDGFFIFKLMIRGDSFLL